MKPRLFVDSLGRALSFRRRSSSHDHRGARSSCRDTTNNSNNKNNNNNNNNNNKKTNKQIKKNKPAKDSECDDERETRATATATTLWLGAGGCAEDDHERHNETATTAAAAKGCLICLNPMTRADVAHPPMCRSSGCDYNFCLACIERLVEPPGQHQPSGMILLHCPNCRSNLGPTICDTVLLRKVDNKSTITNDDDNDEKDDKDDEKDAADIDDAQQARWALFRAMNSDVTLLREIAQARDREAHFLQTKVWNRQQQQHHLSTGSESREAADAVGMDFINNNMNDDDDEWGFEVDLRVGPHESIKLPREWFPCSVFQASEIKTDRTLLAGLEGALSLEEQEQLTRCLISGDTMQLAQAAERMATVAGSVYGLRRNTGSSPLACSERINNQSNSTGSLKRSTTLPSKLTCQHQQQQQQLHLRRPSIYHWIENGKRARSSSVLKHVASNSHKNDSTSSHDGASVVPIYHHNYRQHTKFYASKITEHRQIDRQMREKLAYLRRHPLPVRMPKYAELVVHFDRAPGELDPQQIVKSLPVRFCNDVWDGTLLDAYTKLYVTPHNTHYYLRRGGGSLPLPHQQHQRSEQPGFFSPYSNGKNYAHPYRFRPTSTFVNNYSVSRRHPGPDDIRHAFPHLHKSIHNDSNKTKSKTSATNHNNFDKNNNKSKQLLRIDTPHPRVLIAAVGDIQASQQGVLKGDVVTHVNGMELRDACVDDVVALICSLLYHPPASCQSTTTSTKISQHPQVAGAPQATVNANNNNNIQQQQRHGGVGTTSITTTSTTTTLTLQLVLNADRVTAEALQLRAMASIY